MATGSPQRAGRMTRIHVGTRGGLIVADEDTPDEVTSHFSGSTVEAVAIDTNRPRQVCVVPYSGLVFVIS